MKSLFTIAAVVAAVTVPILIMSAPKKSTPAPVRVTDTDDIFEWELHED